MTIIRKLSYPQIMMASHVAIMRRASNAVREVPPRYGADNSWEGDIHGCCSELVVARFLNLFWCGSVNSDPGKKKHKDVGGLIEVRSKGLHPKKKDYGLTLHQPDENEVPFVCVWPDPPRYHLQGWCLASEGKIQDNWGDHAGQNRPYFQVPLGVLRPMHTLREWVEANKGKADLLLGEESDE